MTFTPPLRVRKQLLPLTDLNAEDVPEHRLAVGTDIAPVLALLYAMGPQEPKLLTTDANGNLNLTIGGTTVTVPADAMAALAGLPVLSEGAIFNGAAFDRLRSASAANMALPVSIGVQLAAAPGEWSASSAAAAGVASSASRAAGGPGVRHVFKGGSFGFSASTALAAIATVTVNLRDGASGIGAVLRSWQFTLPAATVAPVAVEIPAQNIIGSANAAMTLEFAAGVPNLLTFANLNGYDVG